MTLADLEGLIPDDLGERLTYWASVTEGPIVEIGSYKGKSTCYLAEARRTVYAIDPWGLPGNEPGRFRFDLAREDFDEQTARYPNISPIQGFSLAVAKTWTERIGLLYIDGSHHYKDVLADLNAWAPHCDGPILCDDWGTKRNPGVARAIQEFSVNTGRAFHIEAERLAVIEPA